MGIAPTSPKVMFYLASLFITLINWLFIACAFSIGLRPLVVIFLRCIISFKFNSYFLFNEFHTFMTQLFNHMPTPFNPAALFSTSPFVTKACIVMTDTATARTVFPLSGPTLPMSNRPIISLIVLLISEPFNTNNKLRNAFFIPVYSKLFFCSPWHGSNVMY